MTAVPVLRIYGPIGPYSGNVPRLPELDGVVLEGLQSIEIKAGVGDVTRVVLTLVGLEVQIIEPCVVRGDPEQAA